MMTNIRIGMKTLYYTAVGFSISIILYLFGTALFYFSLNNLHNVSATYSISFAVVNRPSVNLMLDSARALPPPPLAVGRTLATSVLAPPPSAATTYDERSSR